jgi:hypothetical protein
MFTMPFFVRMYILIPSRPERLSVELALYSYQLGNGRGVQAGVLCSRSISLNIHVSSQRFDVFSCSSNRGETLSLRAVAVFGCGVFDLPVTFPNVSPRSRLTKACVE